MVILFTGNAATLNALGSPREQGNITLHLVNISNRNNTPSLNIVGDIDIDRGWSRGLSRQV